MLITQNFVKNYTKTKGKGDKMRIMDYKKIERLYINVDMVNGFINEGPMHDISIGKIIGEQVRILNSIDSAKERLIFVVESHKKSCSEFRKFPEHCVEGTSEANIVPQLQKSFDNAMVYKKNSTSAMFAPNFIRDLQQYDNLREVVVMGCCTDICVMNLVIPMINYFDEHNKEVVVTVPKNAVQTYDSPTHSQQEYNEMAFKFMRQAGANIVEEYSR